MPPSFSTHMHTHLTVEEIRPREIKHSFQGTEEVQLEVKPRAFDSKFSVSQLISSLSKIHPIPLPTLFHGLTTV